jgi:hypothetical protein
VMIISPSFEKTAEHGDSAPAAANTGLELL